MTDVGTGCESVKSTSEVLDFDAIFNSLNDTAHNLQAHVPTAFTSHADSSITFKGIFRKNYFKLDGATLDGATNIYIDVPEVCWYVWIIIVVDDLLL